MSKIDSGSWSALDRASCATRETGGSPARFRSAPAPDHPAGKSLPDACQSHTSSERSVAVHEQCSYPAKAAAHGQASGQPGLCVGEERLRSRAGVNKCRDSAFLWFLPSLSQPAQSKAGRLVLPSVLRAGGVAACGHARVGRGGLRSSAEAPGRDHGGSRSLRLQEI
jgi:hypothetical protein